MFFPTILINKTELDEVYSYWPFRQHAHTLVEMFTHEDGLGPHFVRHLHVFQELVGHQLQGILRPWLKIAQNRCHTMGNPLITGIDILRNTSI